MAFDDKEYQTHIFLFFLGIRTETVGEGMSDIRAPVSLIPSAERVSLNVARLASVLKSVYSGFLSRQSAVKVIC